MSHHKKYRDGLNGHRYDHGINVEVAEVCVWAGRLPNHRLGRCTQDSRQTGLLSFTHSLAALGHQLRREGAHLGLVDRTLALGLLQARVVLLQRALGGKREGVGGPPRQALEPHPVLGGWAQVGAHQRVPARAKLHRRQRLRRAAPLARVDGVAVCRGRGRGVRSPASAVARDAQRERAAWAAHFPASRQSGC